MLNFKVKIDPATAFDSYSIWHEADHDDLVLVVALACWVDEKASEPPAWLDAGPLELVISEDEEFGSGSDADDFHEPTFDAIRSFI